MSLQYKTRENSAPDGKAGVYVCCPPDERKLYLDLMAEEVLDCCDCAVWYGNPAAALTGEYRAALEKMRLIVLPVTGTLLTTPNAAMDEVVPFALERHIPVLPILREENLEWYALERFGDIRQLDANERDAAGWSLYPEELARVLSTLLADGTWKEGELRKAAEAGEAAAWDRLAVMYDMGVGVERDLEAALEAREEAAKLYRTACKAAPEDPEQNRRLMEALAAVETLQNELGVPYEEENRYIETLRELEEVCRRGAEHFGQDKAKRRLYRCLMDTAQEYDARCEEQESVRYYRMALELAEKLAKESGKLTQRLMESSCHRALGRMLFGAGKDGQEEYEEALTLDLCLADKLGEDVAVLESLAEDYQFLGDVKRERTDQDLRAFYYRKWVETLGRLVEQTGTGWNRTALCYARVRLATVIPEKEARGQLELAMAECRRMAEETGRTLDWLTLADLYKIRANFFYEDDTVMKEWYAKAEEIFEMLVKPGEASFFVYSAWRSACAKILENLEEDDEALAQQCDRLRALCESTDPQKRS